ncbi:unnamed protein product [Amoebophrya sp. A120]|nr:unnamed protein product [Amoebophrya sp. A120]|eukprot:GSA120T00010897001.1
MTASTKKRLDNSGSYSAPEQEPESDTIKKQENEKEEEMTKDLSHAIGALFFVSFVQLFGYNVYLSITPYLMKPEVLGKDWGYISLFPYGVSNVVFGFAYTYVSEKRKFQQVKEQQPENNDVEKGINANTTTWTRSKFFAGFTFSIRWLIACGSSVLVYVPLFVFAVLYNSRAVALIALVVLGIGNSWLQNCGSGLCTSLNSPRMMTFWSLGNALSSLPTFFFNLIYNVALGNQGYTANLVYILLSIVAIVLVFCYLMLPFAFVRNPLLAKQIELEDLNPEEGSLLNQLEKDAVDHDVETAKPKIVLAERRLVETSEEQAGHDNNDELEPLVTAGTRNKQDEAEEDYSAIQPRSIWAVFADDWPMYTGMFLAFFTTFCIFPALPLLFKAEGIKPDDANDPNDKRICMSNFILLVLGFFNLGDVSGRYLPMLGKPPKKWFLPIVGLRCVFVTTCCFLVCIYETNMAVPFLVDYLFGLSLAYCATWAFMEAGSGIKHPAERAQIGPLLSNALLIGILLGTCFSAFVLRHINQAIGIE